MNRTLIQSISRSWHQAANIHGPVSVAQMFLVLDALLGQDDKSTAWPKSGTCVVCGRAFMVGDVAAFAGPGVLRCVADSRCVAR